jgi:UDP-N-acetylglucosamine 3-dehydrogenase
MKQQKPLKIGVIGIGNMGKHHIRHYSQMPEAELIAICDIQKDLLNKYQEEFNCKTYTDLDTMLEKENLDAVSIVSPSTLHYQMAKKTIQKGIHTLIEKPLTDSLETSKELIELAKKHNIILMVGHIERFNPAVLKLKEIIDSGKLGEIVIISSKRAGVFPSQIKDANVMIDLAVHDIDIVSHLFNKQPDDVTLNSGKALIDSRDDHAELLLKFGSQTGIVQVNWITPIPIRALTLTGTKGYAELNYMTKELTIYESTYNKTIDSIGEQTIKFEPTTKENIPVEKNDQLRTELSNFLSCIHANCAPYVTGQCGYNALKIALNKN